MIKYEWRDSLSPAESEELADLLQRAAGYDAGPEYNSIDFCDVEAALSQRDSSARHMVIWMLPHATAMTEPDEPERIAGLLRLGFTSTNSVEATIVVDPGLRSIGIVTLLLEQVGVDTTLPGGWMGTGAHTVSAWARGDHPAADRLSNRFLIPRTRRVWKLIRSTAVESTDAAPVLESVSPEALGECGWASAVTGARHLHALRGASRMVGVVAMDLRAVHSERFGRCALIDHVVVAPTANLAVRRQLLEGTLAIAHDAQLTGVIIYVDSDDAELVNACRLSGFQHDRTDVRYQLGSL